MSETTDFAAEWKAVEAELDSGVKPEDIKPEVEAEPEAEAAEEPVKPEPQETEPAVAIPENREEQRKTLAALAERLGLHVSEARVEPAERIKWRQEKAAEKAALKAERERFEAERQSHAGLAGKAETAIKLIEDGEVDEALKALFGKGLEDLNKIEIGKLQGRDPRVTRLEKELAKEREEKARIAREAEERSAKEAQARGRQEYVANLSKALSAVAEFKPIADDPELVERVVQLQEQAYDPDDDSTIPADVAARAVLQEVRQRYERLSKLFGAPAASVPEIAPQGGSTPAKRAVKNRTVPQNKASTASPQTRSLSDDEWWKMAKEAMAAADG